MSLRSLLKGIIIWVLSRMPARLSALSILMYHSISDSGAFFSLLPAEFERQMRYIRDSGLTTIFASEIDKRMKNGELANAACITFDDGYEDAYTNAFPVLKRLGIKATVFLITNEISGSYTNSEGRTFSLLSKAQIEEMQKSGLVEFMPHGHTHRKLTGLSETEQEEELISSRNVVQELTGTDPRVFAYPRGRTAPAIESLVKRLGFSLALGVVPGLVRPPSNRFNLPRNAVDRQASFQEFKLKLSDNLELYLRLVHIFAV